MIGREKPRAYARRLPPSDRADISGREEMRAASSHDAMEGVDSVLGEALETFSTWLMMQGKRSMRELSLNYPMQKVRVRRPGLCIALQWLRELTACFLLQTTPFVLRFHGPLSPEIRL